MADEWMSYGVGTQGGYFAYPRLSKELRYALQPICKFRQFCDIKEAMGKSSGDIVLFDKIGAISTVGAALTETNEIPLRYLHMGRGSLTLNEYGNGIQYTGKMEALSQFNVDSPMIRTLKDDAASILDKKAGIVFKGTEYKYMSTTTAVGNFESRAAGNTIASAYSNKGGWRLAHIDDCVRLLKQRKVEPYDGENYICIASPMFLYQLKKGGDWREDIHYGDPERAFSGEVGRCRGVRFIEETNYLSNSMGTSTNHYGEAVLFGKDYVVEGVAVPEEIRAKIPTDFGRSKALAWYFLGGWARMFKYNDSGQKAHAIHLCGKTV